MACTLPACRRLAGLLVLLALALGAGQAMAQSGTGAKFGARDPRSCAARKEPTKGDPTSAQLRQYFICEQERITRSVASGELLYLLTDVTLEVGKGRPFNGRTDSWPDIDTSQTVYPIRGAYISWQCGELGRGGNEPGHSCSKLEQPHARGICYRDTFGDWHCKFIDPDQTAITNACPGSGGAPRCRLPPPTGG